MTTTTTRNSTWSGRPQRRSSLAGEEIKWSLPKMNPMIKNIKETDRSSRIPVSLSLKECLRNWMRTMTTQLTKFPKWRKNKQQVPLRRPLLLLPPVAECGEGASRSRTGSAPKIRNTAGMISIVELISVVGKPKQFRFGFGRNMFRFRCFGYLLFRWFGRNTFFGRKRLFRPKWLFLPKGLASLFCTNFEKICLLPQVKLYVTWNMCISPK